MISIRMSILHDVRAKQPIGLICRQSNAHKSGYKLFEVIFDFFGILLVLSMTSK